MNSINKYNLNDSVNLKVFVEDRGIFILNNNVLRCKLKNIKGIIVKIKNITSYEYKRTKKETVLYEIEYTYSEHVYSEYGDGYVRKKYKIELDEFHIKKMELKK